MIVRCVCGKKKRDKKRLQKWVHKCYKYIWSDRNWEPLRRMEARGVNMQNVMSCLGVTSVKRKIEKGVLD